MHYEPAKWLGKVWSAYRLKAVHGAKGVKTIANYAIRDCTDFNPNVKIVIDMNK